MTLFDGITARIVETPRLNAGILERAADDANASADRTIVFVHGNVSSAQFWQVAMLALPRDLRVIAVDLRGFGESDSLPVDATRGLRDFSDDLHSVLETLGIETAHFVGWSMGGGVIMQYALDYPALSLTLESPVSPYGFGGTRRDGSRLTDDDAGTGAGGANPDFVARLAAKDTTDEAPTSPRSVFRASYIAPDFHSVNEDHWVESMLTTSTAEGNYPGDAKASENWPGFAPGEIGVLNAMAPQYFNVSSIVDLEDKPGILWVRGDADIIVSDNSIFDINNLGKLGLIPEWPGDEAAPAQEMVGQTRDVLEAYVAAGGHVVERVFEGVGHAPHLEEPEDFRAALLSRIAYVPVGGPPTEAIVLKSAD